MDTFFLENAFLIRNLSVQNSNAFEIHNYFFHKDDVASNISFLKSVQRKYVCDHQKKKKTDEKGKSSRKTLN